MLIQLGTALVDPELAFAHSAGRMALVDPDLAIVQSAAKLAVVKVACGHLAVAIAVVDMAFGHSAANVTEAEVAFASWIYSSGFAAAGSSL